MGGKAMSNEENTTPEASSWSAFGDGSASAFNFVSATNYVLAPHGSPIWQGSADDLAALVRDARRFRRMEARYCDEASGRPTHGAIQLERWDAEWMDWVPLSNGPLAAIADALPEVEQP